MLVAAAKRAATSEDPHDATSFASGRLCLEVGLKAFLPHCRSRAQMCVSLFLLLQMLCLSSLFSVEEPDPLQTDTMHSSIEQHFSIA